MKYINRYNIIAAAVISFFQPIGVKAESCSVDAGQVVKIEIPLTYVDSSGTQSYFRSELGSGSRDVYLKFKERTDVPSEFFNVCTVKGFNATDTWAGTDCTPPLVGRSEQIFDAYRSFVPYHMEVFTLMGNENDRYYLDKGRVMRIYRSKYCNSGAEQGYEREFDVTWRLSEPVSVEDIIDPETTPGTSRITWISDQSLNPADPVEGLLARTLVSVSGQSSSYSKFKWNPKSCGEWKFTPIFWRWKIGEAYETGSRIEGKELESEPDEDGFYLLEGDVEAIEGFKTEFLHIEAKKNCSDLGEGDAFGGAGSAYFYMGLGALDANASAGTVGFYIDTISQEVFGPAKLGYAQKYGTTLVRHPIDNSVRQIIAPRAFVDVVRPSSALAADYQSSTTYDIDDEVLYQDYVYVSLQSSNTGNNPLLESSYWGRKAPVWSDITYSLGEQAWNANALWEVDVASTTEEPLPGAADWTEIYRPSEYEVRFYRPDEYVTSPDSATGLYSIVVGSVPFVTYTIENPTPTASNPGQLQVEEERGGSIVNTFFWTESGNNWTFSQGSGLIVAELNQDAAFDDATVVGATRTERSKLKNDSNEIALDVLRTYEMYPWGEELISEARDPDGVNRVTLYHYHDEVTASANYGKLKMEIGPFGSWSYYVYDGSGRTIKTISQYKNSSAPAANDLPVAVQETANRVVEHLFDTDADANWDTDDGELKLTIGRLPDDDQANVANEVSRSYRIKHAELEDGHVLGLVSAVKKTSYIECTVVGAAWDATTNLVSIRREIDEGDLKGRLLSMEGPDGSVQIYTYEYEDFDSISIKTTIQKGKYNYTPAKEFEPLGEKRIEVVDELGKLQWREIYFVDDLDVETLISSEIVTAWDSDTGKPTHFQYLDGTTRILNYDCCGLEYEYGRDGIYTQYTYDGVGRISDIRRGQTQTSYVLDAAGRRIQTAISYDGESLVTSAEYNLAGELVSSVDSAGRLTKHSRDTLTVGSDAFIRRQTSFSYDEGETPVWATTDLSYQDGYPYRTSGTGVVAQGYDHGSSAAGEQYRTETILKDDLTASGEWTTTISDMQGRTQYIRQPALDPNTTGDAETEYHYDSDGRLEWVDDPVDIRTHYVYNVYGDVEKTYVGDDTNGPVQETETLYLPASWDNNIMARITYSLVGDDSADEARFEESLADVTSGNEQRTVYTQYGVTRTTVTTHTDAVLASGQDPYEPALRTVTSTVTDSQDNQVSKTVSIYEDGLLISATSYDTQDQILVQSTNAYDALGRLKTVTSGNGTTTYDYYADGQLKSVITPPAVASPSSSGDLPQVTSFAYEEQADGTRTKTTTLPDGKQQVEIYYANGGLKSLTGARTYPVEYLYDYAGRMVTMKTWQDYSSGTPALTQWVYNNRGLLEEKYYDYDAGNPASADLSYVYDDRGRLVTRTGGRGINTTYSYDPNYGYQTGISYSDSTPSVTYSQFDRASRPGAISDASGDRTLAYDKGQLDLETYTSGALADMEINRKFDDAARYSGYDLLDDTTSLNAVDLDYDPVTGRLETVSFDHGSQMHTATYGYVSGLGRVNSVIQDNGSATILAVSKTYDDLHRLRSLHYDPGHQEFGMSFAYNAANQLTRSTALDGTGSYWVYEYDDLGQVIDARKQLPLKGVIPGYDFGYGYDDIGNRTVASRDGSLDREQQYYSELNEGGHAGANALNQYGSRSVPRVLGVMGSADAGATVTVNTQSTVRTGDYFQALLDYSGETNPDDARAVTLDIEATLAGAGANNSDAIAEMTKEVYLPATPDDFTYDDDGNLKTDWRWTYTWNGENRLIALEPSATAVSLGLPNEKIAYGYDSQGRRFLREVFAWDSQTTDWESTPQEHTVFIYDGWNLVGERTFAGGSSPTEESYYVWGLDMSESLQGAGGVGGLLAVIDADDDVAYPVYDHNGNVRAYVDGVSGQSIAEYEYDLFGGTIRSSGVKADALQFRFSTKHQDAESQLYYYGYRWYDAELGRWPARDPIEERGGMNLYGFVGNNPLSRWDWLGLNLKAFPEVTDDLSYGQQTDSGQIHAGETVVAKYWPDEIAKTDGCIVEAVAEIKNATISYHVLIDPDVDKAPDGATVREHEWHHIGLYKAEWKTLQTEVQVYLGESYRAEASNEYCAAILRLMLNTMNNIRLVEATYRNEKYDNQVYGKQGAQGLNTLKMEYTNILNELENLWSESKCSATSLPSKAE